VNFILVPRLNRQQILTDWLSGGSGETLLINMQAPKKTGDEIDSLTFLGQPGIYINIRIPVK
jgi:hypothetical protein